MPGNVSCVIMGQPLRCDICTSCFSLFTCLASQTNLLCVRVAAQCLCVYKYSKAASRTALFEGIRSRNPLKIGVSCIRSAENTIFLMVSGPLKKKQFFFGRPILSLYVIKKKLETSVLDRMNFSSLQIKVFRPFLEFILSKPAL